MKVVVGFVCNNTVFVYGEYFGILHRDEKLEDGWYILTPVKTTTDKATVSRSIYKSVSRKMTKIEVSDFLNVNLCNNKGLGLMLDDYFDMIPDSTRNDSRMTVLKADFESIDGLCIQMFRTGEMRAFVFKIAEVLSVRLTNKYKKDYAIDIDANEQITIDNKVKNTADDAVK